MASVIMTIYNPVSENLNATEPENGGKAEGNCVSVRRGGKQPKAKEQSQMQVNSIRCVLMASLLANGEACAKRNLSGRDRPESVEDRINMYGWSGNARKEVYVNGESCIGKTVEGTPRHAAVRASV